MIHDLLLVATYTWRILALLVLVAIATYVICRPGRDYPDEITRSLFDD